MARSSRAIWRGARTHKLSPTCARSPSWSGNSVTPPSQSTFPPRGMDAFGSIAAAALPDIRLVLQPSLGYCPAAWPIDALIKLYLNETAPAQYAFEPFDVYLEIL